MPETFDTPIVKRQLYNRVLLLVWSAIAFTLSSISHVNKLDTHGTLKFLAHSILSAAIIFCLLCVMIKNRAIKVLVGLLVIIHFTLSITHDADMSISVWLSFFSAPSSEVSAYINDNLLTILISATLLLMIALLPVPAFKSRKPALLAGSVGSVYLLVPAVFNVPILMDKPDYASHVHSRLATGGTQTSADIHFVALEMSDRLPFIKSMVGLAHTASYLLTGKETFSGSWDNVVVADAAPSLLVLVIGESTRARNLSLYGYERKTTPALDTLQSDGRINTVRHAYSAGTNTWNSLPAMLTHTGPKNNETLSVIQLAKQAGYTTHWISNQAKNDAWGLNVSEIAAHSDKVVYLNNDDMDIGYDEVLLPYLDSALKADTAKNFIVLHLYTNHNTFHERYPQRFEIYDVNSSQRDQINLKNSYDNTIYYLDYLLADIIKRVNDASGSFMFVADHGLTGFDSARPLVHDIRSNTAMDSIHIPLILAGKNKDALPPEQVYSLYYFECLFSTWSMITAGEFDHQGFCEKQMNSDKITFIGADLTIRTADPLISLPDIPEKPES